MRAALRISPNEHLPDEELLFRSKQKSVLQMCAISTSKLATQCMPKRNVHPLMCDRVEEHNGIKCTRQSKNRTLPPQSTKDSLIHKMTEVWELLPEAVRSESQERKQSHLIKKWAQENFTFLS